MPANSDQYPHRYSGSFKPGSMLRSLRSLLTLSLFAWLLTGCSGNEEELDLTANIREAYIEAQEGLNVGNYRKAIRIFEALQARFPFSEFASQIQLELMYAYYKEGRNEEAIEAAETFLRENPTHARVDYAHYVKGLSYFDRGQSGLEKLFRKDINKRPPKDGEIAFRTFAELVERYPASPYANDAEQRLVYLMNRLAAYENEVARFYLKRGAYVAALNRAKNAVEVYQDADSSADSLKLMIEAYEGLGMTELANDTRRVLRENYSSEPIALN